MQQQQQPASTTIQKHRTYPNTSSAPPKPHTHPSMAAQEQPISIGKLPVLQGRVFERLQRFAAQPADLQDDAKQFQAFIEQNKNMLFESNTHALIKSVYSVKGEALIDSIIQWLQSRRASTPATEATTTPAAAEDATGANQVPAQHGTTQASSEQGAAAGKRCGSTGSQTSRLPFNTIGEETLGATTKGSLGGARKGSSANHLYRARQIAEALVLSGFITPYKDDVKHLNATEPEHYVQDNELLVPVAKSVSELGTTSVWSVVDGAIYAGSMKRKAGVLGQFTDGKDVYVVLNERNNTAYLFDSDIAREPITEMRVQSVSVEFDNEHFAFGVRVTPVSADSKDKPELFNAGSKQVQSEFGNALFSLGAQHPESDIAKLVKADARGGVVGHEASQNAKVTATETTTGPQEVRGADVATSGVPSEHQSHAFAAHEDPTRGTSSGAAATPLTGHEYRSQAQGVSQRTPIGDDAPVSQYHHPDHRSIAHNDTSLGAPYYGATPPQQQGQDFGAHQASANQAQYEAGGASTTHHHPNQHSMARENPSHQAAPSGNAGGTPMSKTHLDQHFRAQGDPSYTASYDSASAPSKFHGGDREDMSRASNVADSAAAKVANFVTKHHHPNAQGDQGSAAPSNPSKYQEHPTGAYGTHAAP